MQIFSLYIYHYIVTHIIDILPRKLSDPIVLRPICMMFNCESVKLNCVASTAGVTTCDDVGLGLIEAVKVKDGMAEIAVLRDIDITDEVRVKDAFAVSTSICKMKILLL
jgi:hypothetical protein